MNLAAFKGPSGLLGVTGIAFASCLACSSAKSRHPPVAAGSAGGADASTSSTDGGQNGGSGSELDGSNGGSGRGGRSNGGSAGSNGRGDGSIELRDGSIGAGDGSIGRGGNGGTSAGAGGGSGNGGHAGAGSGGYTCPSDSPDASVPSFSTLCSVTGQWGPGVAVPVDSNGYDELVAVTPDELTLVKRTLSSTLTFWAADRASTSVSFDAPQNVGASSVVALSPDGLRLVTLSADGLIFQELTRNDRSSAFGAPSDGAFTTLNANASANALVFFAATIAPDDHTLYYTASDGTPDGYPLYVSTRTSSEPWPVGSSLQQCELQTHGSLVPVPTGVSADGLTLFFFDGARRIARAAFARTAGGPFLRFTDLGALLQAQPNAACDRLYYWTNGVSPLLVAPAQ